MAATSATAADAPRYLPSLFTVSYMRIAQARVPKQLLYSAVRAISPMTVCSQNGVSPASYGIMARTRTKGALLPPNLDVDGEPTSQIPPEAARGWLVLKRVERSRQARHPKPFHSMPGRNLGAPAEKTHTHTHTLTCITYLQWVNLDPSLSRSPSPLVAVVVWLWIPVLDLLPILHLLVIHGGHGQSLGRPASEGHEASGNKSMKKEHRDHGNQHVSEMAVLPAVRR